jgi:hypothetical protein
LSIRLGVAQGVGAVDERQAFNPKTPDCTRIVAVDIAAFMTGMQIAFPQELQRGPATWARTFAVPPVQECRCNFSVEHVNFSGNDVCPKHREAFVFGRPRKQRPRLDTGALFVRCV